MTNGVSRHTPPVTGNQGTLPPASSTSQQQTPVQHNQPTSTTAGDSLAARRALELRRRQSLEAAGRSHLMEPLSSTSSPVMTPAHLHSLPAVSPQQMVEMFNSLVPASGRMTLQQEARFNELSPALLSDDAAICDVLFGAPGGEEDIGSSELGLGSTEVVDPLSGSTVLGQEQEPIQSNLAAVTEETRSLQKSTKSGKGGETDLPPLPSGSLQEIAELAPARSEGAGIFKRRTKPLTEAQKTNIAHRLDMLQQRTVDWDKNHPMDPEKFAQALKLIEEGHKEKKPLLRNKKYSQAADLALQARGIDGETWKKARHAIGMQGLADVYDSAATMSLIVPAITAATTFGSDALGVIGGKLLKYMAWWGLYAASNAAGQIVVDAYQDTAVRHEGLPNFLPELAKTMELKEFPKEVAARLREMRPVMQQVIDEAARENPDRAALDKLVDQLKGPAAELEELHKKYQQRIARGQANFVKYETQVAFKVGTAPGVAVAGVMGGPFALWGAMAGQQILQAPFGYMDEILLKKHIFRSNLKYGEFRTEKAIALGITPDDPRWSGECIDMAKLKAMWTPPVDVLQSNIEFIYTDELADRQRKISKMDKKITELKDEAEKLPAGSDKRRNIESDLRKIGAERNRQHEKLTTLTSDIGLFEAGIKKIKEGATAEEGKKAATPTEWSQLSPNGTIAKSLLSSKAHFAKLTAAKFARPGEYTAQVLDREGGLALPRTVFGAISDGMRLDAPVPEQGAPVSGEATQEIEAAGPSASNEAAAAALAQVGILTGNAYANPVTKFMKQIYIRAAGLPVAPAIEDGKVMRETVLEKNRRPITGSEWIKPTVEVPLPDGGTKTVDITKTRAFWKASHSAALSMALGAKDFATGFAKHMKAPFVLPFRAAQAAIADHQGKSTLKKLDQMIQRFPPAPEMTDISEVNPIAQARLATFQAQREMAAKNREEASLLENRVWWDMSDAEFRVLGPIPEETESGLEEVTDTKGKAREVVAESSGTAALVFPEVPTSLPEFPEVPTHDPALESESESEKETRERVPAS